MGDRAHVIFKNSYAVSATIYLEQDGYHVPTYIDALRREASGEELNLGYAAARFVGIAHKDIPGIEALGVYGTHAEVADAILNEDSDLLASCSDGDAGLVIVNVSDFSWQAYDGYLAKEG